MVEAGDSALSAHPLSAPYNSAPLHVYSKVFTKKSSGPRYFLTFLDFDRQTQQDLHQHGADNSRSLARILEADTAPSGTLNLRQNGTCTLRVAHRLPATRRETFLKSRMWG